LLVMSMAPWVVLVPSQLAMPRTLSNATYVSEATGARLAEELASSCTVLIPMAPVPSVAPEACVQLVALLPTV
jgi:hypothetical protein